MNRYLNTWVQRQEGTLCILGNHKIQYGRGKRREERREEWRWVEEREREEIIIQFQVEK